jgi:hypothetical protein
MSLKLTWALAGGLALSAGGAGYEAVQRDKAEDRAAAAELGLAAFTTCANPKSVTINAAMNTLLTENLALAGTNINMLRHVGTSGANIVEYAPGALKSYTDMVGFYTYLPTTNKGVYGDRTLSDGSSRVGPFDAAEKVPPFACK